MVFEIKGSSVEEGLGKSVYGLSFTVTKIDGDIVMTDSFPKEFNKNHYAPFEYKEGEEYFRDIYDNGEFIISEKTGEAYLLPRKGKAIKVEGSKEEFEKKIEAQGKENKFKRLLSECKIEARIRTHAYDGQSGVLEVALAENTDWFNDYPDNPFEAYAILADFEKRTGRIVEASYEGGTSGFLEKSGYNDATEAALPYDIIEGSKYPTAIKFRRISRDSMDYVRQNCHISK